MYIYSDKLSVPQPQDNVQPLTSQSAQRNFYYTDQGMSGSLARGDTNASFSHLCDLSMATPSFSRAEQRKLTDLLSPSQSAQAIRWNREKHPAKSNVRPEDIIIDLTRYVDFNAVREAVKKQLGGTSNDTINAVFVEAVHQFQAKIYFHKADQSGEVGLSTLDSLGIVKHNLREKFGDVYGRNILKIRSKEISDLTNGEFNAQNWYDFIVAPSFLGHRINKNSQGIHLSLLRKLREAENYLLSLPLYADMTPVALGRILGLGKESVRYSGGRIGPKNQSMHGFGLALDIDVVGNPWIGAAWIESDSKKRNERYKFLETLKSASKGALDGGSKGTITSYLHTVAEKSGSDTRAAYEVLSRRNEEFKTFLKNHPDELRYWRSSATFGNRDPLNGFLNLHSDLVYALRQKSLLAWGAIDFGPNASGDIMHFDMRTVAVGREIVEAIRQAGKRPPYVPNPSHHPIKSSSTSPLPPAKSPQHNPGESPSIPVLPMFLADIVRGGTLTFSIALKILAGERDENSLTNLIFYSRHPELPNGYKLKSHEKALASEWMNIRTRLVKPLLERLKNNRPNVISTTKELQASTPSSGGMQIKSGACDKRVKFRKIVREGRGKDRKEKEIPIWEFPGRSALFFKAGMSIDADGAPNAYHPKNIGIDYNQNAGYPPELGKKPYGIATNQRGLPFIQKETDPFPGYFVSPTSLKDASKQRSDPARYVDSTKIPYIALPSTFKNSLGVSLGDFAIVVNSKTGKISPAIFADVGPRFKLGEGSIKLSQALGNDPFVGGKAKRGIPNNTVYYIVFPGSGNGKPRSLLEIYSKAEKRFKDWGGIQQLKICFPDF